MPALHPDETILWEGRPDPRLRFGIETMATGIFAVALILACLGLGTVINRSVPGMFWAIFAPGLVIGAFIVGSYPLYQSLRDRRTRYVLTNQRALIIGAGNPGVTPADRDGYAIPDAQRLTLIAGDPGTIWFGARPTKGRNARPHNSIDVGFERIPAASDVYQIMRSITQVTP